MLIFIFPWHALPVFSNKKMHAYFYSRKEEECLLASQLFPKNTKLWTHANNGEYFRHVSSYIPTIYKSGTRSGFQLSSQHGNLLL